MAIALGLRILKMFRGQSSQNLERRAFSEMLALLFLPRDTTWLEVGQWHTIYGRPWLLMEINEVDLQDGGPLIEVIFVRD